MKLFRIIRLSFYAVFLCTLGLGYFIYVSALSKPLENRETNLEIPSGVGISWLAKHLEDQGIIDNRYVFRAYAWLNSRDTTIKAGEYTLVDIDNIPDLVSKVGEGRVIKYSITLIEGKTFKDYLVKLTAQKTLVDELSAMSDAEIMRKLGAPGQNPEGMFAPQTYFFQRGDTDFDVLKQAYQQQSTIAQEAWEARASDVQIKSVYQLLILASIIEKETGAAVERPEISGVFTNRLKIGMKLQTDPTVIYGMGDKYNGNIRRKATPIAMPGQASIVAAANPQTTDALYFVGKGDGTHYFSKTLKEHNNAVIKYQLGGKPKAFSSNPSSD